MTIDHPHLRANPACPICASNKGTGPIVCWTCYRSLGMKYGNPEVEAKLDRAEAWLCNNPSL